MAENILQKMVRNAESAYMNSNSESTGLVKSRLGVEERKVRRSIRLALIVLGFGLGFLVLVVDSSWVTNSPLLNVAGGILCFLFLTACFFTGILWWLVTGSGVLIEWAGDMLPFGVQPYRSALCMPLVFIAIAIFLGRLCEACKQLSWIERRWHKVLIRIRLMLWLLAAVVWSAALGASTNILWP